MRSMILVAGLTGMSIAAGATEPCETNRKSVAVAMAAHSDQAFRQAKAGEAECLLGEEAAGRTTLSDNDAAKVEQYCSSARSSLPLLRDREASFIARGYADEIPAVKAERAAAERSVGLCNQAEFEKQRSAEKLRSDDASLAPALSAALCSNQEGRAEVLIDIATAKRDSRIAGVVDLDEMYRLQQVVVSYNVTIANLKRDMKERRIKPLSCRIPLVARIANCVGSGDTACDSETRRYASLVSGY